MPVKILTATEAMLIGQAILDAIAILEAEGYPDEANECKNSLEILNKLVDGDIEELLKDE